MSRSSSHRYALSGLALLTLVGCNDVGFTELVTTDFFQQNSRNAVDLLVVIDNSCSMVQEQANLARNFDVLIGTFGGADVDWQIAVTTTDVEAEKYRGLLVGGDDELVLRGPNGEIDRVEYTRAWTFEPGVALSLPSDDIDRFRFTYNDNVINWCPAASDYNDLGMKGTPGEWNPGCDGEPAFTPPTVSPLPAPRAPAGGELVFSEILPWSLGEADSLDSRCEWFELTNRTAAVLDLTGVTLFDLGTNHLQFPDGAVVDPYEAVVVARRDTDNCGLDADFAFPQGFVLNQDIRHLTRDTPDVTELFAENVAQGTIGTGIEMGLEAARLTFLGHPSTITVDPSNPGEPVDLPERAYYVEDNGAWLRDDAALAVLFVSDEDDVSPYPVDAYARFFSALKGDPGYRDPHLMSMSAVVAKEPAPNPTLPSCESINGQAFYGRRYLEAVSVSEGLSESICEQDFAPIVERLGLTLSGLELEFQLSKWPRIDSLEVSLYSSDSDDSLEAVLVIDEDFAYDADCNILRFTEDQVPPSDWYVVAEFISLPPTAEPERDEDCPR